MRSILFTILAFLLTINMGSSAPTVNPSLRPTASPTLPVGSCPGLSQTDITGLTSSVTDSQGNTYTGLTQTQLLAWCSAGQNLWTQNSPSPSIGFDSNLLEYIKNKLIIGNNKVYILINQITQTIQNNSNSSQPFYLQSNINAILYILLLNYQSAALANYNLVNIAMCLTNPAGEAIFNPKICNSFLNLLNDLSQTV